ncbi:DUF1569 domain-containing protein [Sungkyunkwania multivorans]|uniref:DUF1569 domain-containing protein n=1 Tax=Sungkyunkwania multivorans TaxID=1173618 RepID=A0ABW3CUE9_9FLAO
MKSIFEPESYNELKVRVAKLTPETQPKWGKMNVAQMMYHCQKALEVPLEKSDLKRPNLAMRVLFRGFKTSMYSDKLWKANLPTAPGFAITDEREFETEATRLNDLMDELHARKDGPPLPKHPAFGNFSKEQWGKMHYKHLDHHLRQFGV